MRRQKVPLSLQTALTPAQAQCPTLEALPNTQDLRCSLVKKYLRIPCKDVGRAPEIPDEGHHLPRGIICSPEQSPVGPAY